MLPTWRGWGVLGGGALILLLVLVSQVHEFLSPNRPVYGGALVVEGWAPDYALREAMTEFTNHHYLKLYVTGGPLEAGSYLSAYTSFAEMGAATLVGMGMPRTAVQAVPAPHVWRNRTYTSAVALRRWLDQRGLPGGKFHVLTVGPHARRTWLLFALGLGPEAEVGITAIEDRSYDPHRWWLSSEGVRSTIGEVIAYVYVKLLWHPPKETRPTPKGQPRGH